MSSLFTKATGLKAALQKQFLNCKPDIQVQKHGLDIRIAFTYRPHLLPEYVGHVQFNENSMDANFAPLQGMEINKEEMQNILARFCEQQNIKKLDVNINYQQKSTPALQAA